MKVLRLFLAAALILAAPCARADMLLAGVGSAGLPLNFLPASFAAYSTRLLDVRYAGKAVNIRRASDSAATDIGFSGGNLDAAAFNTFCAATTCFVAKWYDQSGNSRDAAQATAANQPQIVLQRSTLNNRAALLFGDASVFQLDVASVSASIFGAGGFYSSVVDFSGTPTFPDRFFNHITTLFLNNATNALQLNQPATGTGVWVTTTALTAGAHTVDLLYSSAALANVPTITVDGAAKATTNTQPTGTITAESGTLSTGNGGSNNRGFPGYMAENLYFAAQPSAGQLAALRANQKAYWGTP